MWISSLFADVAVGLGGKRFGLLHELLPGAMRFALLVTPGITTGEFTIAEVKSAAMAIGRQIEILTATTNVDIDAAFASLARKRADALLVAPQILFSTRHVQLVTLAARHAVPTMYYQRGRSWRTDELRVKHYRSGASARRLHRLHSLKREANRLPILRAVKFEFVINMQTARLLGIEVPNSIQLLADEIIE